MTYTRRTATLKRIAGTRYPAGIVRQPDLGARCLWIRYWKWPMPKPAGKVTR